MYKLLPILLFAYGLALTTEDIYDNSYALIIGIDKYKNVKKLNYAVDDAESIKAILEESFYFPSDNISILTNEEATKQNILKSFSYITKKAKVNDRVLIFFAGHGVTMDLPGGGELGYLLPVDGDNEDLYFSSIGMDELRKIALMSNAKHVLYLVDACYGGIAAVGSRGLDSKSTPNYIEKITKNKSRQIITAGGRGEKVIEKSEWGHSAFSLNLSRGLKDANADLNADGYITGNELGMFLSEKVTIDSENQQTPQYGRMTSEEGEFVFIISNSKQEIKNTEHSTEIDYDLLSSKIAEKLKGEKKIENNEEKNKNVKKIKIIEILSSSINKQISWGIDFTLTGNMPSTNTDGRVISLIPKLIYKNNNIKLSIGFGFKELNSFNYRVADHQNQWYPTFEQYYDKELNQKSFVHLGLQYNIIKIGAFPIIINIDSDIIKISDDRFYYGSASNFGIDGGTYNYYSIGFGTQLMLLNSKIKIEFGGFDITNVLRNKILNDSYMTESPDVLQSNIYVRIGYDMLPF